SWLDPVCSISQRRTHPRIVLREEQRLSAGQIRPERAIAATRAFPPARTSTRRPSCRSPGMAERLRAAVVALLFSCAAGAFASSTAHGAAPAESASDTRDAVFARSQLWQA